jgi:hypothetical protein
MASCATIICHDETGAALHTIRQGAVPSAEPVDLCDRLLADAVAILQQRPDLRVVGLSDRALEMRNLLRSALDETALGTTVYELLAFWHLVEKLAPAARVVYGEGDGGAVLRGWRSPIWSAMGSCSAIPGRGGGACPSGVARPRRLLWQERTPRRPAQAYAGFSATESQLSLSGPVRSRGARQRRRRNCLTVCGL